MSKIEIKLILMLIFIEVTVACNSSKHNEMHSAGKLESSGFVSDSTVIARNKAVVRQLHEEVWSKGNIDLIDAIYNTKMLVHVPLDSPWTTLERLKQDVAAHRRAFPDWQEEVQQLIAEGEMVVSKYRVSGTQKGIFWDIEPSGNTVAMEEVVVFRFKNGKIAEQWSYPNLYEYRRQLLNNKQHVEK